MSKHALLSPSSAYRWLNCTPSARECETIPHEETRYSKEGTLAHKVAHEKWNNPDYPLVRDLPIDMPDVINAYIDWVNKRVDELAETSLDAPFVEWEKKLNLAKYVPECWGTADIVMMTDDTLEIVDLKYGAGWKVSAKNNYQLMLYALGALDYYKYAPKNGAGPQSDLIQHIRLTIYQPRSDNIDTWELSKDQLLSWAAAIAEPARRAQEGLGEKRVGDWCKWCPVRYTCQARADHHLVLYESAKGLNLSQQLFAAKEIKKWIADIETHAYKTLTEGGEVDGWKLIQGRASRFIPDIKEAFAILQKTKHARDLWIQPSELRSPAQIEKNIGKKEFKALLGDLVEVEYGRPVMVKSSENGVEVKTLEKDFEGVDNNESDD